jgi:hypothetical protein
MGCMRYAINNPLKLHMSINFPIPLPASPLKGEEFPSPTFATTY